MPLRRTVIAAILLASLLGIAVGKSDEPQVLTEEDIVRMFVQGVDPDELIREINTSPGEYDLSDEMLDELRIAGIPEPILQAMLRRQAKLHPDIAQKANNLVISRISGGYLKTAVIWIFTRSLTRCMPSRSKSEPDP